MTKWQHYCFERVRNGVKEWGIASGDSPEKAMQSVLGSHPERYGVTYAFVYLTPEDKDPNSDQAIEWGDYNA